MFGAIPSGSHPTLFYFGRLSRCRAEERSIIRRLLAASPMADNGSASSALPEPTLNRSHPRGKTESFFSSDPDDHSGTISRQSKYSGCRTSGRTGMKRRSVLALPALIGLTSCAGGGGGGGGMGGHLTLRNVPTLDQAWLSVPEPVRQRLATDPVFGTPPENGIEVIAERTAAWEDRDIITVQRYKDFGHGYGTNFSWITRSGGIDNSGLYISFCDVFSIIEFRPAIMLDNSVDGYIKGGGISNGGNFEKILEIESASGKCFPLSIGNQIHVVMKRARIGDDLNLRQDDQRSSWRAEIKLSVTEQIGQTELWWRLLMGSLVLKPRDYLLDQPSFLMGDHHSVINGSRVESLFSSVWGQFVFTKSESQGFFGWAAGVDDRSRLRGEGMTLNDVGRQRLTEAIAAIGQEVPRFERAGRHASNEARQRGRALGASGLAQLQAGDATTALQTLRQSVDLSPGDDQTHFVLAAALGKAGRAESDRVKILASRRLQRLHLMAAAQLSPGSAISNQASALLGKVPMT